MVNQIIYKCPLRSIAEFYGLCNGKTIYVKPSIEPLLDVSGGRDWKTIFLNDFPQSLLSL